MQGRGKFVVNDDPFASPAAASIVHPDCVRIIHAFATDQGNVVCSQHCRAEVRQGFTVKRFVQNPPSERLRRRALRRQQGGCTEKQNRNHAGGQIRHWHNLGKIQGETRRVRRTLTRLSTWRSRPASSIRTPCSCSSANQFSNRAASVGCRLTCNPPSSPASKRTTERPCCAALMVTCPCRRSGSRSALG